MPLLLLLLLLLVYLPMLDPAVTTHSHVVQQWR
jgi:hypothetical protein